MQQGTFLVLLLLLCACGACAVPAGRQCAVLSAEYGLRLEWEFPNSAEITIGILAGEPVGPRGWAVIGLYPLNAPDPHSAIRSDVFALGRSDANLCPTVRPDVTCNADRLCLVDGYMPGSEFLTDSVQSLKGFNDSRSIEMWDDGGSFGARFTRLLDTGDSTQDWPIDVSSGVGPGTNNRIVQGSAMSIVWACHNALDLRSSCSVDRHLLTPGTPPAGCFGVSRVDFALPSSCPSPEASTAATPPPPPPPCPFPAIDATDNCVGVFPGDEGSFSSSSDSVSFSNAAKESQAQWDSHFTSSFLSTSPDPAKAARVPACKAAYAAYYCLYGGGVRSVCIAGTDSNTCGNHLCRAAEDACNVTSFCASQSIAADTSGCYAGLSTSSPDSVNDGATSLAVGISLVAAIVIAEAYGHG